MANHPHFANALQDLKTRFGVEASDLTPDELFELVECVRNVENPFSEVNADAIGFPVKVCDGLYFWRLSAGASCWLDEYVGRWWGDGRNDKKYFWALCYALANARKPEAFATLDTPTEAYERIRDFVVKCPATVEEMRLGADKVLGRAIDEDDPKNQRNAVASKAKDWAKVAARLASQSGIPAEEWLWGRSAVFTVKAYNDLSAFAERFCAAGGSGEHLPDLLDDAFNRLGRAKVRISRRIAAERKKEDCRE